MSARLSAAQGFGVADPELVHTESIDNIPPEFRRVGAEVVFQNDRGEIKKFIVTHVDDGQITIDGNNPLAVQFRSQFQQQSCDAQVKSMQAYIQQLYQFGQSRQPESADPGGLQVILLLCEQMLPHLSDQEIDLTETISMEMDIGLTSPQLYVSLGDLKLN